MIHNLFTADQRIFESVLTYLEVLDIATLLVVGVCLWIRRKTWRYKWEQPKTIGLALIGLGALLKAPPISWLIDRDVLHGLYLLSAHTLVVSGIASFAYSAEHKLRSDTAIRRWHITFVVFPWTLGVAAMVGLFTAGASSQLDQLFQYPVGYTMAYWLVYDTLTVYFLVIWAYALSYLFYDPPSRRAAGLYLLAVGLGLIAATCRALLVTVNDQVPDVLLINVANTANALAIGVFAVVAARLWQRRERIINGAPRRCVCGSRKCACASIRGKNLLNQGPCDECHMG